MLFQAFDMFYHPSRRKHLVDQKFLSIELEFILNRCGSESLLPKKIQHPTMRNDLQVTTTEIRIQYTMVS